MNLLRGKWEVVESAPGIFQYLFTVHLTFPDSAPDSITPSIGLRAKTYIEAMLNHAGHALKDVLDEQHAGDPDRLISDTLEDELEALLATVKSWEEICKERS